MLHLHNHEGMFTHTSPKVSFYFGLVLGLAVVSTVGFLITLSLYASGGRSSSRIAGGDTKPSVAGDVAAPPQNSKIEIAPVTKDDHVRGSENARLTFVEYSDLECPFCKVFHETMQQVLDAYPKDVRWVYRHLPLDSLHSKARPEAEATECAAEQGKFWELADKIFDVTPSNNGLNLDDLPRLAADVGVDVQKFEACRKEGRYRNKIQEHYEDATRAGGQGTPYTVVITENGETFPISGALPFDSLKASIDQFLTL